MNHVQSFFLSVCGWLVFTAFVVVFAVIICSAIDDMKKLFRALCPKRGNNQNRDSVNTKPNRPMTRTHEALIGALLPFCKQQTVLARNGATNSANPTTDATTTRVVAALQNHPGMDSEDAGHLLKILDALYPGGNSAVFKTLADSLINNGWPDEESETANSGNWPVGSVAVVIAGTSRHKRVLNRGYIIVEAGDRPTPLGLRGSGEHRRPSFEPGDIRAATDAEISDTLARLTSAQVKALVCDLSGRDPFKTVLAGVISNPENRCGCR